MLQTIREYTQGWIAGVVITLVILSFALWGIHSYFVGGSVNTYVAQVNGVDITKEQLSFVYDRLRRQTKNNALPNSSKRESLLKERSLQILVATEVMKQSALNQGFGIYDEQIDTFIQSMPEFQVKGQFSLERFQEVLSTNLLSTSEYLEMIRTNLLIDQPRIGVMLSSFALPNEINQMIKLVNQERSFDYMIIPLQYFIAQVKTIPSEQIKAYYAAHQPEFMTPDQVKVDYLELTLNALKRTINPTPSLLSSFYNENINAYVQPKKWKFLVIELPIKTKADETHAASDPKQNAIKIVEHLKSRINYKEIAKKFGATVTEKNLSLDQIPAGLQNTIVNMSKESVSEPFIVDNNVVIVKVLTIEEPKTLSFEEVKDKIRESYIRQKAEEKFASLKEELASLTYEHPESLQYAAKTLNIPIQSSQFFSRDKSGQGIAQSQKVREVAFSNEVLKNENNSDVINVNPETMIVLHLKTHLPAKLLPLDNVITKQIEATLIKQEADNRIQHFAKELQAQLNRGVDPTQLAKQHKLLWTSIGLMGRYSTKVDSAILDIVFRLPHPDKQHPIVYGNTKLPNGYAIVGLKNIQEGKITDKKQFDIFAEQYQSSEGGLEYQFYYQSQMKSAKIDGVAQS